MSLIQTRAYQAGDEAAIIQLFSMVFGEILTEEQWRWKYTANGGCEPLARLAFDGNNQLVGHAGAILLQGWRHGKPLPILQICDVMVQPAARGQLGGRNVFTRLARELLESIAERWPSAIAYGFPGLRPFRLGEYVKVYAALETAHSLQLPGLTTKRVPSLINTRYLAWDEQRLDSIWDKLAPRHLGLAVRRDAAYLYWRYATHPQHHYRLLGFHVCGHFLGWAVLRIREQRLLVVDILLAPRWLNAALLALQRLAGVAGLNMLEIWLPEQQLQRLHGVINTTPVIVTHMVWRATLPTATVARELYYTMGDLDIF